MEVTGLNRDRYLINNPIWVEVREIPSEAIYVSTTITRLNTDGTEIPENAPTTLRLHSINGVLYFDLSEGIKAFFPVPDYRNTGSNNTPIGHNYQKARVTFKATSQTGIIVEEIQFTRTYIRGGKDGPGFNLSLAQGEVLKESTRIPRWGTYPVRKYWLNDLNEIVSSGIIAETETDVRRVVGCNPIYFRFLNTSGGYSYWLFENWELSKSAKKAQRIESRDLDYSLGAEISFQLEVEGRIEKEYYRTVRALLQSPEIYVRDLESKVYNDSLVNTASRSQPWYKVYAAPNSMKTPSNEELIEVKLKFDLLSKQRPSVVW